MSIGTGTRSTQLVGRGASINSTRVDTRRQHRDPGSATAATSNYLAALATQPPGVLQDAYFDLISAFYACGAWDLTTGLFVFAALDQQAALVNLRAPSVSGATSGSPTFTPYRGFTGNGSNAVITSGYTISATTGYAQNNAHVGVYGAWLSGADGPMLGHGGASGSTTISRASGALATRLNNATEDAGAAIGDGPAHILLSRSASGSYTPYVAGIARTDVSQASGSPVAQQFAGLRITTTYASANVRISGMHFGGALSAAQAAAVAAAWAAFAMAVGANTTS